MTRSKEFVRDLQRRLTESSANRRYDWKDGREWKPEKGERQAVDLVGQPLKGGPVLLIEVELRRGDPSSNVLKIWIWKLHKKLKNDFYSIPSILAVLQQEELYPDKEGQVSREKNGEG